MPYEETLRSTEKPHSLILEGRSRMSVSGVTNVERFDEREILLNTSQGALLVRGAGLHMERLALETGEAVLAGSVDALEYEEMRKEGGLLARLFR